MLAEEFHELLAEFSSDPIYALSTTGQELFHSNMLWWLANCRLEQSMPVWRALGLSTEHHEPLGARREWRHVDLCLGRERGQPSLIVENKVHAVPQTDQLRRYYEDIRTQVDDVGVIEWCLLTLLPPGVVIPSPWRVVMYDQLVEPLRVTAGSLQKTFEQTLVNRYADLIARLVRLREMFDPATSLDLAIQLNPDVRGELADARLLPLVEKLRMSRLVELVRAHKDRKLGLWEAGLSNTHGSAQYFVPGPRRRQFGWQLQSGQMRLAIMTGPKESVTGRGPARRERRQQLIEREYSDYFDLAGRYGIDDLSTLNAYSGRRTWLGYEPSFVYKYRPLRSDITWEQLIDLCVDLSDRAESYVADLKRRPKGITASELPPDLPARS